METERASFDTCTCTITSMDTHHITLQGYWPLGCSLILRNGHGALSINGNLVTGDPSIN